MKSEKNLKNSDNANFCLIQVVDNVLRKAHIVYINKFRVEWIIVIMESQTREGDKVHLNKLYLSFSSFFSLFLLDEQHNITQNYVEETVKKAHLIFCSHYEWIIFSLLLGQQKISKFHPNFCLDFSSFFSEIFH